MNASRQNRQTEIFQNSQKQNTAVELGVGEEDWTVNWNLLDAMDGTAINFSNPYRPESRRQNFSLNVADLNAGQHGEIGFTLAYVLGTTLGRMVKNSGLGDEPHRVLNEFPVFSRKKPSGLPVRAVFLICNRGSFLA